MSRRRRVAAAAFALAALGSAGACQAGATRLCDAPRTLAPADQDRLLQVAAVVRSELERSGAALALVSRSGLDLGRFGHRYSHAGVSLQANPAAPWAVRQLYYACDEAAPRLFDQGMAAFVLGTDEPRAGHVSLVFLPPPQAAAVEHAALDRERALALLGARYSANAHAFSAAYQNCNQWLAELLASAWDDGDAAGATTLDDAQAPRPSGARARAQRWLQSRGYEPAVFDVGWAVEQAALLFVPWVHRDDHPPADRDARRYRVSMPASIEAFVRSTVAGASRVEICHADGRVVVHRGWEPVADGCTPGEGDEVIPLD